MTGATGPAGAAGPVLAGELRAGWARRAPHKTAVREDGRSLTWAELDAQVGALASGMAALGVALVDARGDFRRAGRRVDVFAALAASPWHGVPRHVIAR